MFVREPIDTYQAPLALNTAWYGAALHPVPFTGEQSQLSVSPQAMYAHDSAGADGQVKRQTRSEAKCYVSTHPLYASTVFSRESLRSRYIYIVCRINQICNNVQQLEFVNNNYTEYNVMANIPPSLSPLSWVKMVVVPRRLVIWEWQRFLFGVAV